MKPTQIIIVSIFLIYGFSPSFTHAASLTNISDFLSRLKAGEYANHTIQFTSNSGMIGGEMIVSFNDSVSDMGSIDYQDIDLLYGPAGSERQQALYVQPGTNVWGVSVNALSKKIVFTYPVASGFPILSHDRVIIKIGNHVTYDSLSTRSQFRQIKNGDSVFGGQQVQIQTQFDSGKLAIPIVAEDSIGILCRDMLFTPTGLKAENSAGIVKLSWTDAANNESGFFVERSQEVTTAVGDTITTRPTPFDTILTIQSINTSQAVDSKIAAGVTYQYRVRAFNTCGFSEYSQVATVKTPPGTTITAIPMALAPVVQPIISVSTQKPILPSIEKVPELQKELPTKPEQVKKPVEPEKPKEIKKQPTNEEVKKPEPPKVVPNVSGIRVSSTSGNITLQWQNPQVQDFNGVQVQRSNVSFPQSPSSGSTVYSGSSSSFTDSNLAAGTVYYYTIFSLSKNDTTSSGAFMTATTKELPKIPETPNTEEKKQSQPERIIEKRPLLETATEKQLSLETVKPPSISESQVNPPLEPVAPALLQQQSPQQQAVQSQASTVPQPTIQTAVSALPPPASAILAAPQVSAVYAPPAANSAPLPPPSVIVSLPITESIVIAKPEESQRTSSVMTDFSGGAPTAAFTVDIQAHTFSEETKIIVTSLSTIQTRTIDAQATVPRGHEAVGDVVYKINIQTAKGKSVKKFDKPLRLTFRYDKSLVQAVSEQSLKVYYWESSLTSWVPLPSSVDSTTGVIVAEVSHATLFSIFGEQRKDISREQRMEMRVEAQAPTALKRSVSYLLRPEDIHLTVFSKLWGKQVDSGFVGETVYVPPSSILDMCIPLSLFSVDVDTVTLILSNPLNTEQYFLKVDPDRQCYATSIIAPKDQGVYTFELKSKGADDRTRTNQFSLMVISPLEAVAAPLVLNISEGFGTPESVILLALLCFIIIGYTTVAVRQKVASSQTKGPTTNNVRYTM